MFILKELPRGSQRLGVFLLPENKKAPVKTEAAGLALDRCKKDNLIITFDQDLTKRKIKTALSLVVERFSLVEMRRIELLEICPPVDKMTASRGLCFFKTLKVRQLWTRFDRDFVRSSNQLFQLHGSRHHPEYVRMSRRSTSRQRGPLCP